MREEIEGNLEKLEEFNNSDIGGVDVAQNVVQLKKRFDEQSERFNSTLTNELEVIVF